MLGSLCLSIIPLAFAGSFETIEHPGGEIHPHVAGQFLLEVEDRDTFPTTYTLNGVAFGLAFYDEHGLVAWTQARASRPESIPVAGGGTTAFDLTWAGECPSISLPPGTYSVQRTAYFSFSGSGAYTGTATGWVGARWP